MSVWMARAALLSAVLALCSCGGGGGDGSSSSTTQLGGSTHTTPDPGSTNVKTDIPATGGQDAGSPGTGGSGTGTPDTGHPGGNTGSGDSHHDGPGTGGSGTGGSGTTDPGTDSPGSNGPGTGISCNGTIGGCFDANTVQIGKYKNNKKAAASYTFDDGVASSFRIADIFESLGLRATFYIIAGIIPNEDWVKWKGLMQKGHEIGNHSMTHEIDMSQPDVSDATLDTEINGSRRILIDKLGMRVLTFAFPWHQYTDRALRMALQNHVDVRRLERQDEPAYSFAFFDMEPDHHPDPTKILDDVNTQLQATVNRGGWFVAGGHGIDGDGWSPVTSDFLKSHLAFASRISDLWIDTYLNVYRYRSCRSHATAELSVLSSDKATLRLGGDFDAALCTEPLTVILPCKDPSKSVPNVQVHDETGKAIPFEYAGGQLLINLRPGEKAVIEFAS